MEKMSFYIKKQMIYVNVEITNNKHMYLKVKNGEILVSAPKRIKKIDIQKFVSEHIEKFAQYIEDMKGALLYSISEKFIFLFGKKYTFQILTGFNRKKIIIKNEKMYIQTKDGNDDEIEKVIKKHLKDTLFNYILLASPKFEEKLGVPQHIIKVIYKTRTWGTNIINKRTISYSSRLAHYSKDIIDSVIVHELAHYLEPNHSRSFWNIVLSVVPNYKKLREKLKENKTIEE